MADDLRHFFEQTTEDEKASLRSRIPTDALPSPIPASTPVPSALPTPTSDQRPVKIVPKGLRSFDAQDADFFLELLPGPRDREGLPDSIRFWKTRIEERDADNTFAVGLIYGPSGCGKSSLMKAGLLPRLSKDVIAVYVEATAGGDGGSTAERSAETLSWPARQPGTERDAGGTAPWTRHFGRARKC